jgi:hypothetical protein
MQLRIFNGGSSCEATRSQYIAIWRYRSKHFFDRYVAPTPIAAATLDARGAVGSLAAEDLDYWERLSLC